MVWSLDKYETYIYSIRDLSPHIQASNLVLIRRGKSWAEVMGKILFASDITLEIESLYFTPQPQNEMNG